MIERGIIKFKVHPIAAGRTKEAFWKKGEEWNNKGGKCRLTTSNPYPPHLFFSIRMKVKNGLD